MIFIHSWIRKWVENAIVTREEVIASVINHVSVLTFNDVHIKKRKKKGTCNKIVCYIVGVRSVRGQGLISVHPHDDLDFSLNLQCLCQGARGARDRPAFTHTHTHSLASMQ